MLLSRWHAVLWASALACALTCFLALTATVSRVHAQCATASAGHYESYSGGSISGIVLDPDGRYPVAVYEGPIAGVLPETRTNDEGRYWLTQVAPKPCWVVAEKVEDGYPDPLNGMYGYEWWTLPKVTVEAGTVINDVTVRVFPKVGKLVIGVFDAATELPLKAGYWHVSREDDRELSMGGSSMFPEDGLILLLPPTACRVEVSADGYEPWYYGSDGSKEAASALVMSPSETREIMVFLHRNETNEQDQPAADDEPRTTGH